MLRICVMVSGGGSNLQAIIDKNIENVEVALVISNNENAFALTRAKYHEIKNITITRKNFSTKEDYETTLCQTILSNNIDLIVLAGFTEILSENFINTFENKIINVHPSLIPAFSGKGCYGIKVHEMALARGVKIAGATVHYVTLEVDAGPIIAQSATHVLENDTPETLQKRVMIDCEHVILPQAIAEIASKA